MKRCIAGVIGLVVWFAMSGCATGTTDSNEDPAPEMERSEAKGSAADQPASDVEKQNGKVKGQITGTITPEEVERLIQTLEAEGVLERPE